MAGPFPLAAGVPLAAGAPLAGAPLPAGAPLAGAPLPAGVGAALVLDASTAFFFSSSCLILACHHACPGDKNYKLLLC